MMNILNRRNRTCLPLVSAVFILICHTISAHAAILTDIRIGEYDDYTRIVFEFDAPAEMDRFVTNAPGRLSVIFNDAEVALSRKIPVESSRHIKDLQIWRQNGRLSAVLVLNVDHFQNKSFQLEQPPRIAVDIYPSAQPPAAVLAPTSAIGQEGAVVNTDSPAIAFEKTDANGDIAVPDTSAANDGQKSLSPTSPKADIRASTPLKEPPTPKQAIQITDNGDTARQPPGLSTQEPAATATSSPRPSRLQFYLVIALVAITIIILILLLLMLFSKRHWAEERTPRKVTESLKSQQEHIAALDARIKEQFKRYEEA